MTVFQVLQRLSPRLASLMSYHLWFHPGRRSICTHSPFTPEDTRAETLRINGKNVHYWSAGHGPSVLLMHGWGSCGNRMASIGTALLQQGYRIVWLDAPAHGQSSGWQTNLFEISQSICVIQDREGPFSTVLAHSFGVPCCLYAIHEGLLTDKFIAIATPSTATGLIDKFCRVLKVNKRTRDLHARRVDEFLGDVPIADIAAETLALGIEQECLVIHDKHDRMIKSNEGLSVQKNLRNSSFVLTEKLGHNKILSDPGVISLCLDFIQGETTLEQTAVVSSG